MAKADAGQVMSEAQRIVALSEELHTLPPPEAAQRLRRVGDDIAARALALLNPAEAVDVIGGLPAAQRARVVAAAPEGRGEQWQINLGYPEESVGRLMERAPAGFRRTRGSATSSRPARARQDRRSSPTSSSRTATAVSSAWSRSATCCSPSRDQRLDEVMLRRSVLAAAANAARRGDADRRDAPLPGVSGDRRRTASSSAWSAGRRSSSGRRSTSARRPAAWSASRRRSASRRTGGAACASATRGCSSICSRRSSPRPSSACSRTRWTSIVVLAAFLPVLAGQSGNTGCQALAVTLRGMTLGELRPCSTRRLVIKEAWLGPPERRARRGHRGLRDVVLRALAAHRARPAARGHRLDGDGGVLRHQRHRRRARAADAQEARRRSGDGVEHLPDDRDRRARAWGCCWRWRRCSRCDGPLTLTLSPEDGGEGNIGSSLSPKTGARGIRSSPLPVTGEGRGEGLQSPSSKLSWVQMRP